MEGIGLAISGGVKWVMGFAILKIIGQIITIFISFITYLFVCGVTIYVSRKRFKNVKIWAKILTIITIGLHLILFGLYLLWSWELI